MSPDPAFPAEKLYATPWSNRRREMIALALDEANGKVRRAFADFVRARR